MQNFAQGRNTDIQYIDPDSVFLEQYSDSTSDYRKVKKARQNTAALDSLAKKSSNNWLTKTLYRALVRSNAEMSPHSDPKLIINPEEQFAGYNGRIVRELYFIKMDLDARGSRDSTMTEIQRVIHQFNSFHINTQDWRIRQQIHFGKGDVVESSIFADSERLLRSLRYMEDARIYIEPTYDMDSVDVIIVTKDAFTMNLDVQMTDIGEYSSKLTHHNILGLGIEAAGALYYDDMEANPIGYGFGITNANIWQTHSDLLLRMLCTDYRKYEHVVAIRPFQTEYTRLGGAAEYKSLWELVQLSRQKDTEPQPVDYDYYNSWMGFSTPISSELFNNVVLSSRFFIEDYHDRPNVSPFSYYQYHNKKMVIQSLEFRKIRYFNTALIRSFGIIEDIPFGQTLQLLGGYEETEFDARPYLGTRLTIARYNLFRGYLAVQLSSGTFLTSKHQAQQSTVGLDADYFTRLRSMGRFYLRHFVNFSVTYGYNRFPEESILASETVPGLSSKYLDPFKSKAVLRYEPFLFAPWKPADFQFTFSAHADIAAVGSENILQDQPALVAGLGIGVNIRNDKLILQNLALRFTYFPDSDLYDQHVGGAVSTSNPARYNQIQIRQPEIIPLR